jgi:SAM-dependent methyltransferase
MPEPVYLHIGCGPYKVKGFANTDREFDITKPWPHETHSVDGITSMHVLQELPWRDLVKTLREAYRALKPDGVFRCGVPSIESKLPIDFLLGFGNINLFSAELLRRVLIDSIGFEAVAYPGCGITVSRHPRITAADNRPEETLYIEAFKTEGGMA